MHALALAAVAAWCFVTAVAGGLAGLVLGNIRLPALLLIASSPAAGAGANIGVSALAAATAGTAHVRAGRVDWRLVRWMAPPSIVGAVAGAIVSGALPGHVLLIVIGVVLLAFGLDLLRPRGPRRGRALHGNALAGIVVTGAAIGFLGGVIGLILGSLRMPALLRLVETDVARLIGTNLVVGVAVGLAGVAAHVPSGVDWAALGVGAGASVPGALIGARLTGRLDERTLLRAVGLVLVGAGVAAIVEGAL